MNDKILVLILAMASSIAATTAYAVDTATPERVVAKLQKVPIGVLQIVYL